MKHCKRCDTTKPTTDFYRNKATPDGLAYYCKTCLDACTAVCVARHPWLKHRASYAYRRKHWGGEFPEVPFGEGRNPSRPKAKKRPVPPAAMTCQECGVEYPRHPHGSGIRDYCTPSCQRAAFLRQCAEHNEREKKRRTAARVGMCVFCGVATAAHPNGGPVPKYCCPRHGKLHRALLALEKVA